MIFGVACVQVIAALALAVAPVRVDEQPSARGPAAEEVPSRRVPLEDRPLYGPAPPPIEDAPLDPVLEGSPLEEPPGEHSAPEGDHPAESTSAVEPLDVASSAGEHARPDAEVAPEPPAVPTSAQPRYRGTGLLVAAGIFGSAAFATKVAITALAVPSISENTDHCVESCGATGWLVTGGFAYTPAFAISLFLLGGGMGMRGRWRAHAERLGLERPRRRFPVQPALGWGLFGAGVGVWVVTRLIGGVAVESDAANYGWWDGGYYASLALTIPGVMLGAFGSAYLDGQKRLVAVAPFVGGAGRGMSLAGRF